MMDAVEVSVKVSNEEQTLTQKFIHHSDNLRISHDDPELTKMVDDTIAKFKGKATDVVVKVKYTW